MKSLYRIALVSALVLLPAWAHAQLKNQGKSAVKFVAVGPAGLKIEGTTSELVVSETDGQVVFVVPLAKLDTGISLRNTHMREKYLETSKFPTAELRLPSSTLKRPAAGASVDAKVGATLTIHGVSKPVSASYKAKSDGKVYSVEASTHIKLEDFKITVPSYLGVTVKQDIDIVVSFSATAP